MRYTFRIILFLNINVILMYSFNHLGGLGRQFSNLYLSKPDGIDAQSGGLKIDLQNYLHDCSKLGPVRFVVVGSGAILETVGSFSNLRFADSPKGRLATLSTDNPWFECHIRIDEVHDIKHLTSVKFGKTLYIARFLSRDNTTLLSVILHEPTSETLETWDSLNIKYELLNK